MKRSETVCSRYDIEIAGTNPGVWMFHCHMPNHQDNGMITALVYDGFALPSDARTPLKTV